MQNPNIFLKAREENGLKSGRLACVHRAHLCRLSRVQDLRSAGSGPLVVCSILLSALSLCLWWVVLEICLYSRFEGVFRGFPLLDVCLYCLRALRGLWGFCVRERLGGFMACGVFCLSFLLLSSCPAFVLLSCLASCFACFPALCLVFLSSCLVLFVLVSLWLVVVSFSLSDKTKKKSARAW